MNPTDMSLNLTDQRTAVEGALEAAQAQAVLHFAASALVSESMSAPGKYFRNNVAFRYFNAAGATAQFGGDHQVETHLIPRVLPVNAPQMDSLLEVFRHAPDPRATNTRYRIGPVLSLVAMALLARRRDIAELGRTGVVGPYRARSPRGAG